MYPCESFTRPLAKASTMQLFGDRNQKFKHSHKYQYVYKTYNKIMKHPDDGNWEIKYKVHILTKKWKA